MQIELWWKAPDSSDWFVVKLKRHAPKVTPGGMMSEREIAEYLGVRRGTVFNLLSRAMAKARTKATEILAKPSQGRPTSAH